MHAFPTWSELLRDIGAYDRLRTPPRYDILDIGTEDAQ